MKLIYIKCYPECGGKEIPYTDFWWEPCLVQPVWKTVQNFLKKIKIELLYDLATPLMDIYPKEVK